MKDNWLIKILMLALIGVLLFSVKHLLSPPIIAFLILLVLFPERKNNWVKPFMIFSSIVLILWTFSRLRLILTPFILAFIIAYILHPFVGWMERKKIPRILAIIIAELSVIAFISLFLILLVPILITEINNFINQVPHFIQWANDKMQLIQNWVKNIPYANVHVDTENFMNFGIEELQGSLVKVKDIIALLVSTVWYALMAFIISFFYLKDFKTIKSFFSKITPDKIRGRVKYLIKEIDNVLGLYLRGQLIVSVLDGLIVGIGLSIMGVRYSVFLGVAAAIFSIIPNFGFLFTVMITLIVTLTGPNPVIMSIKAGVIFAIEELLLTMVITPNVMGRSMGINPILIMFSLMVGASLFGVPGLILAAPVTAILTRLYRRYYSKNINVEKKDEENEETEVKENGSK